MFTDEHLPYALIAFSAGIFSAFGVIWLDAVIKYVRWRYK